MNEHKNLLIHLGEALERYRANRRAASAGKESSRSEQEWNRWLPTPGNVIFTLLVVSLLVLTQSVWAKRVAAPMAATIASATTVNYQGHLADAGGSPLDDTVSLTFTIYDAETGGNVIWGPETHTGVEVQDGLFSVGLGTVQPLSAEVWSGGDRYLEIAVNGQTLSPRESIRAVPFAQMAWTVPDGSITTEKIASGAVTDVWYVSPTSKASISSTEWVDVPETSITFTLARAAHVFFAYSMNVQCGRDVGSDWLGARLAVDGIPYRSTGDHYQPHDDAAEWGNSDVTGSLILDLDPGQHTVTLQWRTGTGDVIWSSDPNQMDGYAEARTISVLAFYR